MSSTFAAPAPPGSGIKWGDHTGALVVVKVYSVERGIKTDFGPTDAVRADVAVIDGAGVGEVYRDTLVFPKVLRSQLERSVGSMVLGRVTQGVAKANQSPPWMLGEASADDQAKAAAWWAQKQAASGPVPAAAPEAAPAQQEPAPPATTFTGRPLVDPPASNDVPF